MPNVELLTKERAPLLAQPYYEEGDPGPIASALAHVPELMETALPFIGSAFGTGAVDGRLREIVVLRVSAANRCHYCTETHTVAATRIGFADDEIAALRGQGPVPERWSAVEQAVFAFSEALADRPPEAVSSLRPHFSESEIVELVTLGAATVMLNHFATALELPP